MDYPNLEEIDHMLEAYGKQVVVTGNQEVERFRVDDFSSDDTVFDVSPHAEAAMRYFLRNPVNQKLAVRLVKRLPGFTLEDYALIRPHVAALPAGSRINVCTATPLVLAALVEGAIHIAQAGPYDDPGREMIARPGKRGEVRRGRERRRDEQDQARDDPPHRFILRCLARPCLTMIKQGDRPLGVCPLTPRGFRPPGRRASAPPGCACAPRGSSAAAPASSPGSGRGAP